ncbi:MAG: hypothetical protein WAL80_20260 [Xanthobacteraceae bacterium]
MSAPKEASKPDHETRRRDLITIYRRKYVAGNAALKQLAARPNGVFADALLWHIEHSTRLSSDRELFHLEPIQIEPAYSAPQAENKEGGNDTIEIS